MNTYFGPLDKNSCVYFLIISIIFFVLLVIAIFGNLIWLIKNYQKINFRLISGGLLMMFNIFLAYFVNRLLFTMCSKSLV
jgi:hypothetical protein